MLYLSNFSCFLLIKWAEFIHSTLQFASRSHTQTHGSKCSDARRYWPKYWEQLGFGVFAQEYNFFFIRSFLCYDVILAVILSLLIS